MKQNLVDIFKEIGNLTAIDKGCNDKDGQIHTYLETYDKLFKPFQSGSNILEIGLALGDSIELWDRYFENSKIIGVDVAVVFQKKEYKNEVIIIEADATKVGIVDMLGDTKFDIIVDDGSHMTQDQVTTFNLLKTKMKSGGIYIIEDLLALDIERERYLALHHDVEIIDMRHNGRFDNCLCIIKF